MIEVSEGIIESPQKVVIYAPEGLGKSSLAAMFPRPLFDDTEGSTKKLNVKRLHKGEPPSSWTMLLNDIADIKKDPQICDTFVVDTIDWAEPLCKDYICSTCQVNSIGDVDHGKGYVRLTEEFGRFLNQLSDLIELGINVVLIAHAWPRKFELPDEMGAFDRWEMKLEKRLVPLIKEWADMVLFGSYKTFVVGSGKDGKGTKKAQGGNRVIYTQHHPCWDAKNRHGLPEELSFNSPENGWEQIAHCIPPRSNKPVISSPQPQRAEEVAQDLTEANQTEVITGKHCSVCGELQFTSPSGITCNNGHGGSPSKEDISPKDSPKRVSKKNPYEGIPDALYDLMFDNEVTPEEIQKAVSGKGYYPIDTPIQNYDPNFINGVLVGAWSQVFAMIQSNRGKS